jgi:hypothetical protein
MRCSSVWWPRTMRAFGLLRNARPSSPAGNRVAAPGTGPRTSVTRAGTWATRTGPHTHRKAGHRRPPALLDAAVSTPEQLRSVNGLIAVVDATAGDPTDRLWAPLTRRISDALLSPPHCVGRRVGKTVGGKGSAGWSGWACWTSRQTVQRAVRGSSWPGWRHAVRPERNAWRCRRPPARSVLCR